MIIWLKNNWKQLFVLASISFILFAGFLLGESHVRKQWNAERLIQAQELAKQKDNVIAVEREQVKESVKISEEYQKGLHDGKNELQAAINRLTVERDRLRQQQANGKQPVSATATGSGGCNASQRADFFVTHGEDALRLAGEADDVVKQLKACQNQLTSDRAVFW